MMKQKSKIVALSTATLVLAATFTLGLGAISVSAEDDATQKIITLNLNGGFRVNQSNNVPTYNDEQTATYSTDKDSLVLDWSTVRTMFGNYQALFKYYDFDANGQTAPEEGSTIKVNNLNVNYGTGFDIDHLGRYYLSGKNGAPNSILPAPLLFGLFEDTDGDGVLDESETLYRSGDVLPVADGLNLTCYYEDNYYYSAIQTSDGYQATLEKAWKYDENGDLLSVVSASSVIGGYEVKAPTTTGRTYSARELQPMYMYLYRVGVAAFQDTKTNNRVSFISSIELPSTVVELGDKAFFQQAALSTVTGLDNVTTIGANVFAQTSWVAPASSEWSTYVFGPNLASIRENLFNAYKVNVIFTGKAEDDKVLSATSNTTTTPIGFKQTLFIGRGSTSVTNPDMYIFVPYGQTAEWYPIYGTTVGDTSSYTVDGVSVNANTTQKQNNGGATLLGLNNTCLWNNTPTSTNVLSGNTGAYTSVREMQMVSFNLNGGVTADGKAIATQYMDAGAKSVAYDGTEINLTASNNGVQYTFTNPAEQTLSLLSVTKPADPVKENAEFIGWADSTGYIWTEEDWANGGREGYTSANVELKAIWKDAASYYGKSLSLEGNIGLNVYMNLGEAMLETDAYMEFTYADGTVEQIPASEAVLKSSAYKFTAKVAAKDVADEIVAKFYLEDGSVIECGTFTVSDVIEEYLADAESYENEQAIVTALKNYTSAATAYFGNQTVATVDGVTVDALFTYKPTLEGTVPEGINLVSPTLVLESNTSLRIYFTATAEALAALENDGVEVFRNNANGYYYVEQANIAACDLDTVYSFTIDSVTVKASALSYAYVALNATTSNSNIQNLVKALYLYNQAANSYFNE